MMRAKGRPEQPEAAFVISGFRIAAQRDGPRGAVWAKRTSAVGPSAKTTMTGPFDHAASAWGPTR